VLVECGHSRIRSCSHFNADVLKPAILAAGMKYLYLGKELGGRPDDKRYYDGDGHVLYGLVAEASSSRPESNGCCAGTRASRGPDVQ